MKTLRWVQETNMPLFCITGGFIILFCLLSLWDMSLLGAWVEAGFALAVQYCGAFWQWEVLLTFCIAMGLCCHPGSRSILGNLKKPEFSAFQWGSMIMCTLLAGGGVFWAAGEPVWHFLNPPPYFDAIGVNDAASIALAQSFLHWGFLAWAILGALSTILLMYYHYEKGLPLAPRTLLYPVFGQYALEGVLGVVIDAAAIIAVVAGTVGPIGFLGLQVGYGLESLLGWTNTINHQSLIIVGLVMLYTISSVTGLKRGIQWLSRANMVLALLLLLFVMIAGPTWFIIKHFISGMLTYLGHLIPMSLYRHEASVFADINQLPWLSSWTLFFWGWFMGYGPMMAMFIARISRGRSIRSVIVMLAIIAPLVTHMWYTIIGGTGIAMELNHPGSIAGAIDGFNLPASLLAIVQQLPLGGIISGLFLLLTTVFVATTGDSMTYMISIAMSKKGTSDVVMRVFWGVAMGVMAIVLIRLGNSGISELQRFIVITAVPVSLILLPAMWDAIRITRLKYPELKHESSEHHS